MRVCKKCTLNDNIFSVRINEEGLCNYCQQQINNQTNANTVEYEKREEQFQEACSKYSHLPYQVLLAYSGGKDSTYTLYLLRKKYNVSVLAVTFDNGFITEQTRKNIHEVTANLDVDNITIKPSFRNLAKAFEFAGSHEIYPKKSLERASSICTTCIGIVKSSIYKEAIIRRIPFISFGWTPGQVNIKGSIVKLDYKMLLANQRQIEEPLVKNLGSDFKKYFLDPEWLETQRDYIPSLAHPLVFSRYDENKILETIEGIGWRKPADTDMNSTNCLLNSYSNFIHEKAYGYSPYCLEIGSLVREGFLTREEGLEKIKNAGVEEVIDYVKNELNKYQIS